jgi:hypothetical protein
MTDTTNMPTYECHKTVHALEIKSVGSYRTLENGALVRSLEFTDGSSRDVGEAVFRRYIPSPGDFYVVYEDGYESFSPMDQFKGGYKVKDARTFASIKHDIDMQRRGGSDIKMEKG